MLFNSSSYFLFFLIVLGCYWALPFHRMRLVWLFFVSCLFYAAWDPSCLLLLLIVTAVNYGAALCIAHKRSSQPKLSSLIFIVIVILNLSVLIFFKYLLFFAETISTVVSVAGGSGYTMTVSRFALPVGISFYTFQLIAYMVDVKRGDTEAIKNPLTMGLFIAFFPKIFAGPIVRAHELVPQFQSKRTLNAKELLAGLDLICMGLMKKVLIADQLTPFVDKAFAAPTGLGAGTLLLAVYAYTVQIYCDFSGYTDIARGCAFCFGYFLPENFERPYSAFNVIDFWRKWHITLSNWLRDYLYIPLGGNRKGKVATYRNVLITMGLCGLWHGASWPFVVWGLWHGIALAATRFVHELKGVPTSRPLFDGKFYRFCSIFITFNIVAFGWIFFRAPTFDIAFKIYSGIFSFTLFGSMDLTTFGVVKIGLVSVSLAVLFCVQMLSLVSSRCRFKETLLWSSMRPVAYFLVIAGITMMASQSAQQFIYFQF